MNTTAAAELDPPAPERSDPPPAWLWVLIGGLLIAGIAAALLVDGERSGTERVTAAAGAVEDAGTFAYDLTMEVTGPIASTFTIEGRVDAEARLAASTLRVGGQEIDLISDGDQLYVRLPEEARASYEGKTWARFDPAELSSSIGGVSPSVSPLQTFEQLREAGEVDEVGTEVVRGVETTRYRTVLDLSASVPAGAPAEVRDALREVEVEVWLDDEDRVRRHRTSADLGSVDPAGGAGIGIVTTIESYDFGEPVTIELPPASDVADGGPGGLQAIFAPGVPSGPPSD